MPETVDTTDTTDATAPEGAPQDAPTTETDTPDAPPDFIADKFKDADDPVAAQAKAYRELEQRASKQAAQLREFQEKAGKPVDINFDEAIDKAGIDRDELIETYMKEGLTAEVAKKLEDAGLSRGLAEAFLQSRASDEVLSAAKREEYKRRAFEIAGGEDQFAVLMDWMRVSLGPAEAGDFMRRLEDPSLYEGAVGELKNRRLASLEADKHTSLVGGRATAPRVLSGFKTKKEMHNAREEAEKKYGRGKAFEDEVYKTRLMNTPESIRRGLM